MFKKRRIQQRSVLNSIDVDEELDCYEPKTKKTRVPYEAMLSLVQQQLGGGQPLGTVAAAADEVLGVLKNNNLNKREEIEKLLNPMSNHVFDQMVSFGNLITDFQEEEDNVMIDDNVGFPVVFDEEEEQNGFDDDDLKVETKLLGHLQFDNFSLVKCLLQNRLKIVWCTRLARAEDQETREKIEEEMLDSRLELAAILEQLQVD